MQIVYGQHARHFQQRFLHFVGIQSLRYTFHQHRNTLLDQASRREQHQDAEQKGAQLNTQRYENEESNEIHMDE